MPGSASRSAAASCCSCAGLAQACSRQIATARDVAGSDLRGRGRHVGLADRLHDGAEVRHPLGDLEAQVPGHERHRLGVGEVVQVGPVGPADLQHVAEAAGRDERGRRAAALGDGVDHDRGAVDELPDRPGRDAGFGERGEHAVGQVRGGVRLCSQDAAADRVDRHEIGEGTADVDGKPRPRTRGWCGAVVAGVGTCRCSQPSPRSGNGRSDQ